MAGFLDDGTVLDAEQMRDLLDLTCVQRGLLQFQKMVFRINR